jgi:murein DD-endopeptidase MepM/ murein hydrolase activator NlpD
LIIILIRSVIPRNRLVKINIDDVAAFRIPFAAITGIYELSEKYSVSFSKLLTVYALDNRFFPEKSQTVTDMLAIEKNYILNYDVIDQKYPLSDYSGYYGVISSIFGEIKAFPVQFGFTSEDYMFGNSFGAERSFGEEGIHNGTDILDRENIRGRVGAVSMTDGYVSDMGWSVKDGYFISIVTYNGTTYYYARFDSLAPGLSKGAVVNAGELLGFMGDTGMSKTVGETKNFPVHLHIGISPKTALTKAIFWINPDYILKFAEWRYFQQTEAESAVSGAEPVVLYANIAPPKPTFFNIPL